MSRPKLKSLCGKDHTYNGYTNYETWAVCLWIDNEQSTHEQWTGCAAEILASDNTNEHWTDAEFCRFTLAGQLEDELSQHELPPGLHSDLLGAALSEVDWNEIADHLLDVARES